MTTAAYEMEERRSGGGGALWFWIPLMLVLIGGAALSGVAYLEGDLTILEAIAAGYAGVGALIIGLFAGLIGLVVGLIGAVIGVVAAGGALALTAFLIGSPIIAIVLFVLLMRRDKGCPDPEAHTPL